MDELEEQREMDRLIEEQERDDSAVSYSREPGHEYDVSIHGMDNSLAIDEDGEMFTCFPLERGSVLIGAASWHGTVAGYSKKKCKCLRCRSAWNEYWRNRRAQKKQEAAS